MSTQEVANKLVELCRQGQNMQAMETLYAENIESFEQPGAPNEHLRGLDAVKQKSQQWYENVEEFHGAEVSDPVVAGNHFSVAMKNDITFKKEGRMAIEEVCVYEVKDGKIVRERFFYNMG
jgi:ketosteroid isomerase-like protein